MEQGRQKRECEETDFQMPNIPTLCVNNCGFFGSSATNNLCSKCYKDMILIKSKALAVEAPVAVAREGEENSKSSDLAAVGESLAGEGSKKPKNRCSFCNKRVGLMGFSCRCGDVFCSVHRYSDKHVCAYDYKAAERDAIVKANPIVKADKVEKI